MFQIGNIVMILMSILGLAAAGVVTAQGKDAEVQQVGAVMFAVVAIMLVFFILFLAFTIVLLVGLHKVIILSTLYIPVGVWGKRLKRFSGFQHIKIIDTSVVSQNLTYPSAPGRKQSIRRIPTLYKKWTLHNIL